MTIAELVPLFLAHVAESRKPATLAVYRSGLRGLVARLGDRDLAALTPLDLDALWRATDRYPVGHRKAGELMAPDTRRRNRVAFDQFQKWAISRKAISELIVTKIEKPTGRLRERLPSAEETRAILAAAPPAWRLAYEALRHSGARPNEIASARIEDLRRDEATGELLAIVLAQHKTAEKTKKPRTIAIGRRLGAIVAEAIGDRTSGPIFLDDRGRPWTARNLSRTFRERIRDRLGLPKDLVLYLSRHEHATRLCRKLGIHAAAKALGHAQIATTQRYVKTDLDELRKNQDVFDEEDEGRRAA